jgi:hypothetical protein
LNINKEKRTALSRFVVSRFAQGYSLLILVSVFNNYGRDYSSVRQWAVKAEQNKGPPRWRWQAGTVMRCSWSSRQVTRARRERFSYTSASQNESKTSCLTSGLTPPKHEKRVLRRRNVDVDKASTNIDQNVRE